jgi:7-cyano-7-deazaguanine reductase
MLKIAIVGTHCSGKSTLIQGLSSNFKKIESPTRKAKEAGFPINFQGNSYDLTQKFCANYDLNKLMEVENETDLVIFDRCILDTYIYTKYLWKRGLVSKRCYEEIQKSWESNINSYDLFFLPNHNEIPFQNDGVRVFDKEFQEEIDKEFRQILFAKPFEDFKVKKSWEVKGALEERVKFVEEKINEALIEKKISKSLGSTATYAVYDTFHNPNYLNRLERAELRGKWGLEEKMVNNGVDIWTCYEVSFLNLKGRPVTGILSFYVPANSKYIIESKSLKLYLNSFDMCKLSGVGTFLEIISKNLSELLECKLGMIEFYEEDEAKGKEINLDSFINLDKRKYQDLELNDYKSEEKHLKLIPHGMGDGSFSAFYKTASMRSRCRFTKQKDTGIACFEIKTKGGFEVCPKSLIKYVVSFREVEEFHEGCAEKMVKDFCEQLDKKNFCELMVIINYNRRGGISICPVRYYK